MRVINLYLVFAAQFESQDVLVPWRRPQQSSGDDQLISTADHGEQTSTGPATTTDDDDLPGTGKPGHCQACDAASATQRLDTHITSVLR